MHVVRLYVVRSALSSERDSNHSLFLTRRAITPRRLTFNCKTEKKRERERERKRKKKHARAFARTFSPWMLAIVKTELIGHDLFS